VRSASSGCSTRRHAPSRSSPAHCRKGCESAPRFPAATARTRRDRGYRCARRPTRAAHRPSRSTASRAPNRCGRRHRRDAGGADARTWPGLSPPHAMRRWSPRCRRGGPPAASHRRGIPRATGPCRPASRAGRPRSAPADRWSTRCRSSRWRRCGSAARSTPAHAGSARVRSTPSSGSRPARPARHRPPPRRAESTRARPSVRSGGPP
jgi:hypothetical protein